MGGRGSSSGRGAKGGGSANNAKEPKGRNGSINQLMQNMQVAQTRGMVIDPDTIRKSGFESTSQLQDYKNNQYFSTGVTETRKQEIIIEDAPFTDRKGNGAIVRGRQDAANFVDYLKTKLDVGVEEYAANSWIVHYKNKADFSRKRQTKR